MSTQQQGTNEDGEGSGPPPMPAGLADERFAANVREMRERQGISQADIAKAMRERGWAFHPQTVQRIEAGHRKVSVGEAEAIAAILGTTVDRLTWPGREMSTAAMLDQVTARAESAREQIAEWTRTLLWAQWQLGTSVAEAERARFSDSARIAALITAAKDALVATPEDALEDGRRDYEELRTAGAAMAGDPDDGCPPAILHESEETG